MRTSKLCVCLVVFVISILHISAQEKHVNKYIAATIEGFPFKPVITTTVDSLLAHPRLVLNSADYHITSYQIIMTAKGQDYMGPYFSHGPEIPDSALAMIKRYQGIKEPSLQISIEGIKADHANEQIYVNPVSIKFK